MIKPNRGKLEDKISTITAIYQTINRTKEKIIKLGKGIEKLEGQRIKLENDIGRHLLNNEKTENPVWDYCFRHFSGNDKYSVFDKIMLVEEFINQVKKYKNEKILYINEGLEAGIISGLCEFMVEDTFRHLYVPVKPSLVFLPNKKKWEGVQEDYININPDIFSYPEQKSGEESIWKTDYSNYPEADIVSGELSREEVEIYLGNYNFDKGFKKNSKTEIIKTIKIPNPKF